jgi:hypothetical protein
LWWNRFPKGVKKRGDEEEFKQKTRERHDEFTQGILCLFNGKAY